MSQVQSIIEQARLKAKEPHWSKARLAREIGLHSNALRNLDKPDVQFKTATLDKLEAFLTSQTPPQNGATN